MKKQTGTNRRQFLKLGAVAGAAVGVPYFAPASSLGFGGHVAPSDRISMGFIGTGGKGRHNMVSFLGFKDVQVVAVCDVDAQQKAAALKEVSNRTGSEDCVGYGDFRELCKRDDLDAICVSTPDHWHGIATVAALNAGTDVYCEKPLANSVAEGRAICQAAKKNNRLVQTGSHERSTPSIRFACEQVRNGRLGKLKQVRINLPCDQQHHKRVLAQATAAPVQPVPEGLDFDMWLGHTPKVSYRPWMPDAAAQRCHFWWRFILAYGGGEMTDRGAHVIDLAQLGADKDATGPVEFEASGKRSTGGAFDAFFDFTFTNTYADGLKLIGTSETPRGLRFEGEDGWIFVHIHGGKLEASDAGLLDEKKANNKIDLGRSPGHHRNFIDCVKSRQQPFASAEVGHRTATLCHLNNIAMAVGRKLKWDPVKEQILGDAEANAMLSPKMRSPWKL